MILIQFNGNPLEVPSSMTILQLLEQSGVKSQYCAVERNGEIVSKSNYGTTVLREGDQIEVVTLVGGG